MEVQKLFDNLLASIDWKEAAANSYSNFHAQGVSYLNLLRTDRLTVKLYTFDDVEHNDQGFLVHPHTHAYNFTHRTMAGVITNHNFALSDQDDWNLYAYQTPLNGSPGGLTKLLRCGLTEVESETLEAGQSYYLGHQDIHTLSIQSPYAAALLLQFHDIAAGQPTAMFVPRDVPADCETGLYHRLGAVEGRQIVDQYREETKT